MTSLGEKIKYMRSEHGLTQLDLACMIGLRPGAEAAICKWESGERIPTASNLFKIAKVLHLPAMYFFPQIDDVAYPKTGVSVQKMLKRGFIRWPKRGRPLSSEKFLREKAAQLVEKARRKA